MIFLDTIKQSKIENDLSSESLNWGGTYVENKISGYRTLTVKGREDFTRKINAPEMVGDGSLYLNSRFEAKIMTITFQLLADSGTKLQDKLDQLKNWLYQPQQKFYFADEPDYYYIGTVSKVENSKPGQLNILGTIEITCSDPYKRAKAVKVTGTKINDPKIVYPIVPTLLTFVSTVEGAGFKVSTNDGMKIVVGRGFASGDVITVDFTNLTVKYNSTSVLMDLDLKSNLGDFTIKNGTTFTTSPAGTLTIEYEVMQI